MKFEFATAGRIVFGEGVLGEAIPTFAQFGSRPLVVSGKGGQTPKDWSICSIRQRWIIR